MQTLSCPNHLRSGIAFDFSLEKSIASLSETGVSKNLLENGWRGAFRRIDCHFNSFFGFNCIKEIKLKVVQEKREIKKKLPLNETKLNYNNELKNIKNERLKKTLNKLIEAYNAKNN